MRYKLMLTVLGIAGLKYGLLSFPFFFRTHNFRIKSKGSNMVSMCEALVLQGKHSSSNRGKEGGRGERGRNY